MTANVLDWRDFPKDIPSVKGLIEATLQLPQAHKEIQSGRVCPVQFTNENAVLVKKCVERGDFAHGKAAEYEWSAACMMIAVMERWYQATRHAPGEALALIGEQAPQWCWEMMRRTGGVAPRLGVKEYWIGIAANEHSPTFTGSQGEHKFRENVQLTAAVTLNIWKLLQPIIKGEISLEESDAVLEEAQQGADQMKRGMINLVKAFDKETAEFSLGMRQYLASYPCPVSTGGVDQGFFAAYPVDGRSFPGPNAANIASVPMLDLALGNVNPHYRQMIRKRYDWYTLEEKAAVEIALAGDKSILDSVARSLNVDVNTLTRMDVASCAMVLRTATEKTMTVLNELVKLVRMLGQWNGGHWRGAIGQHVVEAPKFIPSNIAQNLPVDCLHGVSGDALENAQQIYQARASGFVVNILDRALKMVTPATNDPTYGSNVQN